MLSVKHLFESLVAAHEGQIALPFLELIYSWLLSDLLEVIHVSLMLSFITAKSHHNYDSKFYLTPCLNISMTTSTCPSAPRQYPTVR